MSKIIMISGAKRSGKDFLADMLCKYYGDRATKLAFATPIKQIVCGLFGISEDKLDIMKNNEDEYGIEVKAYPNNQPSVTIGSLSFREILQRIGTEATKPVFGNDVWARMVLDKINADTEHDIFIISDFRFNSEYQTLAVSEHKCNIYSIRVDSDIVRVNSDIVEKSLDMHSSETELDNFDFDIEFYNSSQSSVMALNFANLIERLRE